MRYVIDDPQVSGTEAALLGQLRVSQVDAWLARVLEQLTGSGLAEVLFRSGRIDAVYGVLTTDGRRLLVKVHRPPVDMAGRSAAAAAQRMLSAAGFPCAIPIAGARSIEGRVVSVETLLDDGQLGNGHDAAVRRAIASSLAEQMHLLAVRPELVVAVGTAPAWCVYADGPWPTPHETFFDFRVTPDGWSWLDTIAQRSATQILQARDPHDALVVCHADWYCGNLHFNGAQLVACFDWDLVSDTVAVLAGLTAGFHTHGTTEGAEQADPAEVATFLGDFEQAYGARFDPRQQRTAAAAATWSICYTARCHLQMLTEEPAVGSPLHALHEHGEEYLNLRW